MPTPNTTPCTLEALEAYLTEEGYPEARVTYWAPLQDHPHTWVLGWDLGVGGEMDRSFSPDPDPGSTHVEALRYCSGPRAAAEAILASLLDEPEPVEPEPEPEGLDAVRVFNTLLRHPHPSRHCTVASLCEGGIDGARLARLVGSGLFVDTGALWHGSPVLALPAHLRALTENRKGIAPFIEQIILGHLRREAVPVLPGRVVARMSDDASGAEE